MASLKFLQYSFFAALPYSLSASSIQVFVWAGAEVVLRSSSVHPVCEGNESARQFLLLVAPNAGTLRPVLLGMKSSFPYFLISATSNLFRDAVSIHRARSTD